jgi:glycosyltransferase involved in cell wall biosynthesis
MIMNTHKSKIQPLVSIIIPTYNSASVLDACLKSICDQTYTNIDVIVVDKDSRDDTQNIAKRYTNKVFTHGPERSAQRNYGVKKADGEYVLIIDSDMVLSDEVVKELVDVSQKNDFLMGIIPETSFGLGFWARCKALERSFYVGISWMEAARFFPKKVFDEFGGYDEKGVGAEDYDLPQRIENKYCDKKIYHINSYIHHNEGNLSLIRTCKKRFYYGQNILNYKKEDANKSKYAKQSNIFLRYTLFFRDPKKLFKEPHVGLGMIFMKFCEFLFGFFGFLYALFFKSRT